MTQRSMILSAFLAALVLVLVGGAVAYMTEPAPAQLSQMDAPAAPKDVAPKDVAPDVSAPGGSALAERDAEYRQLIAEANRRLSEQQRALEEARRRAQTAESQAARAQAPRLTPIAGERYDDERYEHEDDDRYEHERHEHHGRGVQWDDD